MTKRVGRPTEKLILSSDRTKKRKLSLILANVGGKYLVYTAQMQFNTKVKRDTSIILKEVTSSPRRVTKYKQAFSKAMKKKLLNSLPCRH